MLMEEKEQVQELLRQLLVLEADLNDIEKTTSRTRNESTELGELLKNVEKTSTKLRSDGDKLSKKLNAMLNDS
ncbi:hypothetical protein LCGC14_1220040 [marine sediment metagenome]|uniref:Uncharacterized protein n=1 Tax=marine sediment metagenome TaxID=412755 RepID=A0A0F9LFJ5_9ZZZZ